MKVSTRRALSLAFMRASETARGMSTGAGGAESEERERLGRREVRGAVAARGGSWRTERARRARVHFSRLSDPCPTERSEGEYVAERPRACRGLSTHTVSSGRTTRYRARRGRSVPSWDTNRTRQYSTKALDALAHGSRWSPKDSLRSSFEPALTSFARTPFASRPPCSRVTLFPARSWRRSSVAPPTGRPRSRGR